MIQLTIMKITGYGPWTLTLGFDREHELQMLQSKLYNKLQELFSKKNCLVFLNRSDEYFAVTNGLSLDDHVTIQKELESSFHIKLSMSIGYGENPYDANLDAYEAKKSQKFLNEQIKEHNMKHIKLLVFSPFEDFNIGGIDTRKKAPCVLYNLAKRKDLSEAGNKLKKTKWYDNLFTEDFKRLNIKKPKKLL